VSVAPLPHVQPGDILAGKYRVERVLGQGGMGIVVAAHHIHLDEKVALKFLLPDALRSPEAVGRFLREARAAVKIKCEHVARVSDVGTLPSGAPYMVMEYLEGGDLAAWLEQRGPLPIEQAVEFVLQACVAVADAHALGIVHRDLKPANLFCVRRSDGQLSIKVLDFGISKVTEPGSAPMAMTKTTALMGSPLYMSPEQMRSSRDVDARADIWSLGIILYELVTGRATFLADTVTELAIRVASEPPPPMRPLRAEVSPALEAVIFKCLEKDRDRRYRNVGELATALLPMAPKRARVSVERIAGIVGAGAFWRDDDGLPSVRSPDSMRTSAGTLPPVGRTTVGAPDGGSRRKVAAIGIAAAVLAAAAIGTIVLRRSPAASGPSAAAMAPSAASAPAPTAALSVAVAPAPPTAPPSAHAEPPILPAPASPATASVSAPSPSPGRPAVAATPKARPSAASARTAPAVTEAVVPAAAPTRPESAPAPASASCDPPYYFNADGIRVFKKECL
jgi:serine/threonine-protein kinase